MRARDFRAKAKAALRGHWAIALLTTLVASVLGVFGTYGVSGTSVTEKLSNTDISLIRDFLDTPVGKTALAVLGATLTVGTVYSLARFLLGGALELGYRRFTTQLVDGNKADFSDLFSRFNLFAKGLLMQLLIDLFTTLWLLLFIIPGIIKAYSYAMTSYILLENPDMPVMEAIRASQRMMRGNKWRLFCLRLSFIGWELLCAFSFGIGYLWLNPYKQVAEAAFYREISKTNG